MVDPASAVLGAAPGGAVPSVVSLGRSWDFSTLIAQADPGTATFRLNNATQSAATAMFISDLADSGVDVGSSLAQLEAGDRIYIQDRTNKAKFHLLAVTGPPIDNTSWHEIPVSSVDIGVDFANGDLCTHGFHLGAPDIGGSGAVDQIAVFTSADEVGGFTRLTYAQATDIITLTQAVDGTGGYVLANGAGSATTALDAGGNVTIAATANADLRFSVNGAVSWQVRNTGVLHPVGVTNTRDIGLSSLTVRRIFVNNLRAGTTTALNIERQDGTVWAALSNATGSTAINVTTRWNDGVVLDFGSTNDVRISWSTVQTNDALIIGTNVGTAAQSGNIIVTAAANTGLDHGYGTSADPRLIIASTTTPATNFVALSHNATDALLRVGAGDLEITATQIRAASGNTMVLARGDGIAWVTLAPAAVAVVALDTRFGDAIRLHFGNVNDASMLWSAAQTNDGIIWATGVGSAAQSGNIIITALANVALDHAYVVAANPALYIVNTAAPTTDHMSLTHDGGAGFLRSAGGNLVLQATDANSVILQTSATTRWSVIAAGHLVPNITNTYDVGAAAIAARVVYTRITRADTVNTHQIQRQDGTAWATLAAGTGNTTIGVGTQWNDNVLLQFGTGASDSAIDWSTAQTNDGIVISIGVGTAATSGNIIITAFANGNRDHDHAAAANPTLIIHSATDPDTDNQEFISLSADTANAIIATGNLQMILQPSGNNIIIINGAANATATTLQQATSTFGTPSLLVLTGGAHTTLATTVEMTDVNINLARTVQFATGAIALQRAMRIQAPEYAFVGASVITLAATVALSGPPIAGTNATITDSVTLLIESGATALDGQFRMRTHVSDTIAANQNDYSPTGFDEATVLLVDGGAADRTLTGLALGRLGRVVLLVNVGTTNSLLLTNEDGASAAANRFVNVVGGTIAVRNRGSVTLIYDAVASRWRVSGASV